MIFVIDSSILRAVTEEAELLVRALSNVLGHTLLVLLFALAAGAETSIASADARITEHIVVGDVPMLISRPTKPNPRPRLALFYHGFGQPDSPEDLAKALPLSGANIIGAYVTLPLMAQRKPPGGEEEIQRLQLHDFVNGLYFRSIAGAVAEMPAIVRYLESTYHLDPKMGIDLFGFSAGGSAVLLALTETTLPIRSVAVLNAPLSVRQNVQSWERVLHRPFNWDDSSQQAAERFDVERHAEAIAQRRPHTAILIIQSDSDPLLGVRPAQQAYRALQSAYRPFGMADWVALEVEHSLPHNLTAANEELSKMVFAWFERAESLTALSP